MEERLIELFREYLPAWSWEEWQAAGASDKEDIVINALADLGPDMDIEVDEAYDLFYDWIAGLTEADFGEELQEALPATDERLQVVNYVEYKHSYCHFLAPNLKKLNYLCNVIQPPVEEIKDYIKDILRNPQCRVTAKEQQFLDEIYQHTDTKAIYKHIKNSIDKAYHIMVYVDADGELVYNPTSQQVRDTMEADRAAVAAARAELETQQKANELEKHKQLAIRRAEDAIAQGVIYEYNKANHRSIMADEVFPAIDPETQELIFDPEQKKQIVELTLQQAEKERQAKIAATRAANKERARKAAAQAKLDAPRTHWLTPSVVISGKTLKSKNQVKVVGEENLKDAALKVANEELNWVKTERKFYVATNRPFDWDGKVTIWCEYPDGREEVYRTFSLRKAESLEEAVRVISDPDVLYHATEVGPFYDILNSGVMLHDVRNEGGVHAICFTTDDDYTIYGYPCKIKFSRSKLEQDGYDLYPVDEFEEDEYGSGESEERCDEDINDVRKYVTEVIIDWEFIAVAQDGDDCRLSTGEYDEDGNESDNWDLRLSDFQALLDSLKASGIKVIEKGQPDVNDEYWFDENGEFRYSEKELAFA
jgi:hypothetical protein